MEGDEKSYIKESTRDVYVSNDRRTKVQQNSNRSLACQILKSLIDKFIISHLPIMIPSDRFNIVTVWVHPPWHLWVRI